MEKNNALRRQGKGKNKKKLQLYVKERGAGL